MEEQSTRAQESARQAQESARQAQESAGRRLQQQAREAAKDTTRVAGQLTGLGTETLTVCTDAAQHALRDVLELSAQVTRERARLMTEWQQANLDAMREMQTVALRWATLWPEFLRDPIRGYQRSLEQSIEASHHVLGLARRNAETLAQSCQRLERAADDTTRTLGETFREASTKMQDVYARTDRPRVA
ncbi:MAG TPA: hypothetical protein VN646_06770 [Candidatus Acidoferrum sp.]|jgi:hypothetical protein|nr:hypothetical protein [Candidatus Acidoferrum sp.]